MNLDPTLKGEMAGLGLKISDISVTGLEALVESPNVKSFNFAIMAELAISSSRGDSCERGGGYQRWDMKGYLHFYFVL